VIWWTANNPHTRGGGGDSHHMPGDPSLQECVVYLCGTKVDLVEENKKARKVDVHVVRDYADGE